MRVDRICVLVAVAIGTSPAAALAGTKHSHGSRRSHHTKSGHTADSGTGGAMAGGGGSPSPSNTSPSPSGDPTSPGAPQGSPGATDQTGGQAYGQPNPAQSQTDPGAVAKILPDGLAAAPADAPVAVQQAIWAANRIIGLPYVWGGGHQAFAASGYDCSGTVSYALHGANLLDSPLDSSDFMSWGQRGKGQWITVYTNPGHAYVVIAGLRLDTSSAGDPHGGSGPRWRPTLRSSRGFRARHPVGF